MKKRALILALCLLALTGCGEKAAEQPTAQPAASPTAAVGTQAPAPASRAPESQAPAVTATPTPTPTPAPKEPYDYTKPAKEREAVGEDYFADACFIGDSRVAGFQMWSGIQEGEFITHTGLTVFELDRTKVKYDGEELTVPEALERKRFGKVYTCLGINELGYYDDQGYYDCYCYFIDQIRERQPEAVIYVQLLIPINAQKRVDSGLPDYLTNEQIDIYNDLLTRMAPEKKVVLLDPAEVIVDETGQPPYDMTGDGVHFNRSGYEAWYEYLKTHTVDKGELE